ncbi:MAG: DUF4097 domain-containing protein [Ignavibacteriaceae bacterium]|nr:DUF4097 domain-containing protein [Ignavibacteriaceae bacterium]
MKTVRNSLTIRLSALVLPMLLFVACSTNTVADDVKVIAKGEYTVSAGGNLKVSAPSGNVTINSWNQNKVEVKVYGNEVAEKYIDTRLVQDGNDITVKLEWKGGNNYGRNLEISVSVNVPEKYNTKVNTAGGNLSLTNISGDHSLTTAGGNISLSGMSGTMNSTTAGGNISVSKFTGELKATTAGGNISLSGVKGDTKVSTAGGNMDIEVADGEVEAATAGGEVTMRYSGTVKGIDIATMGGDIDLYLPSDAKVTLKCATMSGEVNTAFSGDFKKTETSLKGDINGGGAKVECSTMGGDIRIKKGS